MGDCLIKGATRSAQQRNLSEMINIRFNPYKSNPSSVRLGS